MSSMKEIDSKDSMKSLLNKAGDGLVIAAFFSNSKDSIKICPVYEDLAKKYTDRAQFVKINMDETDDIHPQYGVTATPTFVFIKNGEAVSDIQLQGSNAGLLEQAIQKHICSLEESVL